MTKKAIVIGGGIGGLAIAIRLSKLNFDVQLFEKNTVPGGKINELHTSGFRFDTGASLFTLPELADELFLLCGKNPRDYFSYKKLERTCRYFYNDGTVLNAYSNAELFAKEAELVLGEPCQNLTNYLKKYEKLYIATAPLFLFNALQRLRNFTKKKFRSSYKHLLKLDVFTSMHKRNRKSFTSEKLVQLFDRYATYNGSDPYRAPATLNMISHLEHNLGAYFPEKGMHSIIKALVKLAKEQGVRISLNSNVEEIQTTGKNVTGVRCNGTVYTANLVVSDADVRSVYMNLLQGIKPPKSVINKELSTSAVIFYWGVNYTSNLDLHNILFAADYKAEFDALFRTKTLYHDPSVYIFISNKLVKSDAPENSENWFVMINVPSSPKQHWKNERENIRKVVLDKINRLLNINIEPHIVCETVADPSTIALNTSAYYGALYGNSSNGIFSAFNRHANFSSTFKNLWFVGGSVHPGGGIPLCLASAKIVADEIESHGI